MRDWLLLSIPTLLIAAFAGQTSDPAPAPSTENEWEQRADYDIDLAHKNIRDCNDRCSRLQEAIDAINARCKCGLTQKPAAPTASSATGTNPPTVVVRAAQPVRNFVKRCVNGVCTLVPVETEETITTETTTTPATVTTTRSYGSAGGWSYSRSYGSAGGWQTSAGTYSGPLRRGRLRGLLCR